MKNLKTKIFFLVPLALTLSCGKENHSELDIAMVEAAGNNQIYSVNVEEIEPTWGRIRIVGRPTNARQTAITGCIGAIESCNAGTSRSFILYASPETVADSGMAGSDKYAAPVDAQGALLQFPFPVNFRQAIMLHIATYVVPVKISNGWLVLPPKSKKVETSKNNKLKEPATNNQVVVSKLTGQQLKKELARLPLLKANARTVESFRISENWQATILSSLVQLGQQIQQSPANNQTQNSQPLQNSQPIQNSQQTVSQPGLQTNVPVDTANLKPLDQGATNYCWGYSAFHMLRTYYFGTDPSGAWAQALGKINSDEGMSSYMRANHENHGDNMMTWIDKFKSNNPQLPDPGWGWEGSISDAGRKLQQNPSIPSSYCNGQHCTALVAYDGSTFTVADSAGGYSYKAGASEIGDESTVSLSGSASGMQGTFP